MIKCHIFSLAVPARENMWHFIMFRENKFHISRKTKKYPLSTYIHISFIYYLSQK
jgi:hypothetical protein